MRRIALSLSCAVLAWAVPRAAKAADADPPLITAAKNGRLEEVLSLLDDGADVTARDRYGYTALMWAVSRSTAAMVQALLEAGAALPPDADPFVPLIEASKNGHLDTVRLLLKRGAKPDAANALGATALITAAGIGRADLVKALLAGGADPDAADRQGQTALIVAAQHGAADVVGALISGRAKLDVQDRFGFTALLWAASDGRTAAVHALLAAGADPSLRAADGKTAAELASSRGHAATARALGGVRP